MGGHITKVKRTRSGNYEAVVYEVGAKRLRPVLVVHGSEALVARALEVLPLAVDNGLVTEARGLESGTFPAAVADDGNRDPIPHLRKGRSSPYSRRT